MRPVTQSSGNKGEEQEVVWKEKKTRGREAELVDSNQTKQTAYTPPGRGLSLTPLCTFPAQGHGHGAGSTEGWKGHLKEGGGQ